MRSNPYTRTRTPSSAELAAKVFDALYPIPDPLTSDEDRARYCHEDLAPLAHDELALERTRVVWCLTFENRPSTWLLDRLDAIDARMRDDA